MKITSKEFEAIFDSIMGEGAFDLFGGYCGVINYIVIAMRSIATQYEKENKKALSESYYSDAHCFYEYLLTNGFYDFN